MKNTELLQLETDTLEANNTITKTTKRLSRPFKIKSIVITSTGVTLSLLSVRIFIGSPNTTDPINDPSCKEITSKLGTSEGILVYNINPVVWPGLDIIVNQQDKAILVKFWNKGGTDIWAAINFHLQMM